MATTRLTRTPSSAGNRKKFNFSFWIKGNDFVSDYIMFSASGSSESAIVFDSSSRLEYYEYNGSSKTTQITTNRVFRDCSAWYHINISIDTTQSTASNRVKFYVNGVQETSLANSTYGAEDFDSLFNNTTAQYIGGNAGGGHFDGSMSYINFNDGYVYPASTFGSTDSTTGEWEINTSPSMTMGTNGFTILKNGNTITDQSTNSNNWTLAAGTLTKTEDCPSNVFATMNPLIRSSNGTFASGNNKFTTSGGAWGSGFTTLGMFNGQGKYYMEFKGASGTKIGYGISDFKASGVIQRTEAGETRYCGEYANSYAYHYGGNFYYSGSSTSTGYDSFTSSNVIGMAVDMDNLKIYFHKDGVYQDSKNPASNNGYTIVAPEGVYLPTITVEDAGAAANFGNGVFDTTAVSSAGTAASTPGIFEYDVPTGYQPLSTKGLNA